VSPVYIPPPLARPSAFTPREQKSSSTLQSFSDLSDDQLADLVFSNKGLQRLKYLNELKKRFGPEEYQALFGAL
jgi:hypothetical protein